MFAKKQPNPYVIRSYRETIDIFQKQIDKIDAKVANGEAISIDDLILRDHLRNSINMLLIDSTVYVSKNVRNPKRFWRKIAKKIK